MAPGLYRVSPVPGRGLGVVATARLPPGHLLLSEAPAMVIPEWSAAALSSAFLQLPEEQQEQVLGLANSQEGVGRLAGVALTNMLPLAEPGAFGIFPTIARVNHSCRPNTNHYQVEGRGLDLRSSGDRGGRGRGGEPAGGQPGGGGGGGDHLLQVPPHLPHNPLHPPGLPSAVTS